jgi:hypothetical protein
MHVGVKYGTSSPNRRGFTGGVPHRFRISETSSLRGTLSFTWFVKNRRSPATGMLAVTFGPWIIPEGRNAKTK